MTRCLGLFCRGTQQIRDCFELIRIAHAVPQAKFSSSIYTYTVVNTNSPRQLDIPMGEGIVEFASAGQLVIVTPFTLAGAMAPVTIAGALTLAHMEALFGITLAQLVRPGAPVMYGTFTSNVDMKSGVAGIRYAGIRQGLLRGWAARAVDRRTVAVLECQRGQYRRCAIRLRE